MIKREDIKYRVGSTGVSTQGNWAMALVYIDARTAHEELDSEFGVGGWEFTWETLPLHDWAVKGTLKCKVGDKWVTREDVGYPQEEKRKGDLNGSEALKDAVSDALKRCAVTFGIGRILYSAPKLFTFNVKLNKGGKVSGFTKEGEEELDSKIDTWYKQVKGK